MAVSSVPSQAIELIPQTGHADNVAAVSFSPEGKYLSSSGNDRQIRLWDLDRGQRLANLNPFQGTDWSIDQHAISRNGRFGAFSASPNYSSKNRVESREIRVLELPAWRLAATLANKAQVKEMAFDRSGESLRVVSYQKGGSSLRAGICPRPSPSSRSPSIKTPASIWTPTMTAFICWAAGVTVID